MQFQQAQQVNKCVSMELPIQWQPPPFGWYKVNWDVAVNKNLQLIGVGVLVRDYHDLVHAALSRTLQLLLELVVAEAMGALIAAEFSRDLGIHDIQIEGDSLLVVKAIRESGTQWSSYGQIVGDARVVLNNLRSWFIAHVKRDANSAAHVLAKEAVRHVNDQIWMEEVPMCIYDIITLEHFALSI